MAEQINEWIELKNHSNNSIKPRNFNFFNRTSLAFWDVNFRKKDHSFSSCDVQRIRIETFIALWRLNLLCIIVLLMIACACCGYCQMAFHDLYIKKKRLNKVKMKIVLINRNGLKNLEPMARGDKCVAITFFFLFDISFSLENNYEGNFINFLVELSTFVT